MNIVFPPKNDDIIEEECSLA